MTNVVQYILNLRDNLSPALWQANSSAQRLESTLGGVRSMAIKLAGSLAIGFGAKEAMDMSDSLTLTTARLELMNDGMQTTAELQEKIFQSSERSRSSYLDTIGVVAKLGVLAKDAFSNNEEIIMFAEQMNKQFKIGGASIQEQSAGMYQLTQAMAAGRLQGDEFRSIMENAPMLAQAISKHMGVSMGELRKMSSEGKITAETIKNALFSASDETNKRFESIPKTFGALWTEFKNNFVKNVFEPIQPYIMDLLGLINEVMKKVKSAFNDLKIDVFFTNLKAIIIDVWGYISNLIAPIVALVKNITSDTKGWMDYLAIIVSFLKESVYPLFLKIITAVTNIVGKIIEFIKNSEILKDLVSFIGMAFGGIFTFVGGLIDAVSWAFDNVIMPIIEAIDNAYKLLKGIDVQEKKTNTGAVGSSWVDNDSLIPGKGAFEKMLLSSKNGSSKETIASPKTKAEGQKNINITVTYNAPLIDDFTIQTTNIQEGLGSLKEKVSAILTGAARDSLMIATN